ncbi:MAG: tRNA pseudouridine(55) synthase TruB [Deltaproteobacteria bacterium RBG_13_49_15]|nr:MAG: tRNA pseudouridine(55) synthase TruB [Deltaproteobacteria bacterium RBG_13_49_15]
MNNELSGILLIDKSAGMTSAGVVAQVKRILNARKVGHAGTLDPFATGVLICCINRATRIARFFLQGDKTYRALLFLGIETDTGDATGRITFQKNSIDFSKDKIRSVLKRFEGGIDQSPPVYSALKYEGVPLYRLAREGNPVQKMPRKVFIREINPVKIKLPEIWFDVRCSTGTYIRSLGTDIGKMLGCGGHIKKLRRLESSGFRVDEAISVEKLKALVEKGDWADRLISMRSALKDLPEHTADARLTEKITHGSPITIDEIPPPSHEDYVKVIDTDNHLLAVLGFSQNKRCYSYCGIFDLPIQAT